MECPVCGSPLVKLTPSGDASMVYAGEGLGVVRVVWRYDCPKCRSGGTLLRDYPVMFKGR